MAKNEVPHQRHNRPQLSTSDGERACATGREFLRRESASIPRTRFPASLCYGPNPPKRDVEGMSVIGTD